MHIAADPLAESRQRMMKAVKGEGMPTLKNPFVHGNLFIIFNIEFPQSLPEHTHEKLRALLPPPLSPPILDSGDDAEQHELTDIDPVRSYSSNKANMVASG